MIYLLDIHALIWWLCKNPTLSNHAFHMIEDHSNTVFISSVTIAEIRIKQKLDKIENLPVDFYERILDEPFQWLPFQHKHANAMYTLPNFHRDPFDWMLIAQCMVEGFTFITRDQKIKQYPIPILTA